MDATVTESRPTAGNPAWRTGCDKQVEQIIRELACEIEVLRARRLACKIWIGGSAIAAAGAVGVGADLRIGGRDSAAILVWTLAGTLIVSLVVGALVLAGVAERLRQLYLEQAAENDVRRLIHSVDDRALWELTALSKRQMARFECLAVGQARLAFAASMTAAGAGLCVLAGCAVTALRSTDVEHGIAAGALATIGSVLSGFLSAVFLGTYDRTTKQLRFYYGQPLVNCYVLHAERILHEAGAGQSDEERHRSLLGLAEQMLRAAERAQEHLFHLQPYDSPERLGLFRRRRPTALPGREPASLAHLAAPVDHLDLGFRR